MAPSLEVMIGHPYHTRDPILPTAAQVPAGTPHFRLSNKASVGRCFALFTPWLWLEAPFWASCSFRHKQHQAPFRPPSEDIRETSLPKDSTHHHILVDGKTPAHWQLTNPPRLGLISPCPTPNQKKKTCEFHSFVQRTVTPDCCVSPGVPKSGGGRFALPL
jgi:hypothetical protein